MNNPTPTTATGFATDEAKKISELLATYMSSRSLSYQQIANESGISKTHIGNLLKPENWDKVGEETWHKAQAFLNSVMAPKAKRNIPTRQFSQVIRMCEDAQRNSRMIFIIGETGQSKTTALRAYRNNTDSAVGYVECHELMTESVFLAEIARSFGLMPKGTRVEMLNMLVDSINRMEKPLLLLDDLGKVYDRVFRLVRLLHDRTNGKMGIIGAGVPYLEDYIHRCAKKDKMGFAELYRRVEYWLPLPRLSDADKEGFVTACGLSADVVKPLLRNVTNYGTLAAIVRNAEIVTGNNLAALTAEMAKKIQVTPR